MDPHAPHATAYLPNPDLQKRVEHALALWAADAMDDKDWATDLKATDNARDTKHRFYIIEDNPQQLAAVIMLSSLSNYPAAWICGVEAALRHWPDARTMVQDLVRIDTSSGSGDYEWRP